LRVSKRRGESRERERERERERWLKNQNIARMEDPSDVASPRIAIELSSLRERATRIFNVIGMELDSRLVTQSLNEKGTRRTREIASTGCATRDIPRE